MKPIRILVADEAKSLPQLQNALRDFELVCATQLREAERLLVEDGIDLFVVGAHFDDSRAMDLVRFIRQDKSHKENPIIVVRLLAAENKQMLRVSFDVMKVVHGISDYIEEDGTPGVEDRILSAVQAAIAAHPRYSKS